MADEVIAEAQQGIRQLIQLLRMITRYLSNRRQTRDGVNATDPFVQRFDQALPGLREEINRGDREQLDDAQLADRFESRFGPQWADHAGPVVESIPPNHEIYADPQLGAARLAFVESQRAEARSRLGRGLMEARARMEADAVGGEHRPGPGTMSVDELQTLLDAEDGRHRQTRPGAQSVADIRARVDSEQDSGRHREGRPNAASVDEIRARLDSEDGQHRQGRPGAVSVDDLQTPRVPEANSRSR